MDIIVSLKSANKKPNCVRYGNRVGRNREHLGGPLGQVNYLFFNLKAMTNHNRVYIFYMHTNLSAREHKLSVEKMLTSISYRNIEITIINTSILISTA